MNYPSSSSHGWLLAPLCLCSISCGEEASPASPQEKELPVTSYPTETVAIKDIDRPIRSTGRVVPLQEVTIGAQVQGKVLPVRKLLQEGKYYRKGKVLLAIDCERPLRRGHYPTPATNPGRS